MNRPDKIYGKGFVGKTLSRFAQLFENELYNERYAAGDGLLQSMDPRIKVLVVLAFMVFIGFTDNCIILVAAGTVSALYAAASALPLRPYLRRTWLYLPTLIFILNLPGASSLLTGGTPLFYIIPAGNFVHEGVYFSTAGLNMALRIALRTGDSMAFAFLLLMTTRWSDLTCGLRRMHLPEIFVSILNMAYRYLFLIAETGTDMMQARHMRTVGAIKSADSRRFVSSRAGQLFIRVHSMSDDIYGAMKLRGYDGSPVNLRELRTGAADWLFVLVNVIILVILTIGGYVF
ncbi:cobalt ECF transporter T component CbiQ [Aminicella lysinilytica]|uniref:Cobalt/nickel transport system permease protein n=1 Tax=Aminicella lysinilytica TaxID=433323 RepID=A0A4R6Q4M0_9FIRM|nr:cobalt ECF transporter T component CbiQ [Aminicella lysinilytica]TDP57304.1 cobalt/nickel transport system permease protein [Aminicella lysinilytica]